MIVIVWRMPSPPLALRWRGPAESLARSALAVPIPPLPTLIGPPGEAGPPAPLDAAILDGGSFT